MRARGECRNEIAARESGAMEDLIPPPETVGDTPDLELALLRRSLPRMAQEVERCDGCHRGLLIGERVYRYASGELRCELCRSRQRAEAESTHRVHGPAFGHSIRVVDRRVGGRAA
jgi:hypothetical protein